MRMVERVDVGGKKMGILGFAQETKMKSRRLLRSKHVIFQLQQLK